MRNKTKAIGILLASALFIGAVTPTTSSVTTATSSDASEISDNDLTTTVEPSEIPDIEPTEPPEDDTEPSTDEDEGQNDKQRYTWMGQYYVAKGQPCVFQDPKKGKINVVSAAGNKCKVKGNKLTVTCKKKGTIKYKITGRKGISYFTILVGGNNKDSKVNKKEYNQTPAKYNGKSYNNFIDVLRNAKKGETHLSLMLSSKEDMKKEAKYNRGIKYGSTQKKVTKKYPSWEDVGTYDEDNCCYVARYYDKKSGFVAVKGFVEDKKYKVKKIVYIGYKNEPIQLQVM